MVQVSDTIQIVIGVLLLVSVVISIVNLRK
ncbi:hypothetical protein MTJW_14480 [Moorella thermoacetica]|nr:hypothetical protein MTJW_14480 [Moorella thermoacetica]